MADRNSSESRLPVRLKMRLQAVLLCGILGLPSIIVTITLFIITQVSAVTRVIMIHQSHMLFLRMMVELIGNIIILRIFQTNTPPENTFTATVPETNTVSHTSNHTDYFELSGKFVYKLYLSTLWIVSISVLIMKKIGINLFIQFLYKRRNTLLFILNI